MAEIDFFGELHRIIMLGCAQEKCHATQQLNTNFSNYAFDHDSAVTDIPIPGYPANLNMVAPRELKRRGIKSQEGRNILLHAIAHIEYNAINLALDAAYRFRNQGTEFYIDWLAIAADEARHFQLLNAYLNQHKCNYGDYPAHNGLWDMAVRTQDDLVARMALVPRVLEARGLDVTPAMIERLTRVDDHDAVAILEVIYNDEIEHVRIGSKWFKYQCQENGLEPRSTFRKLVDQHLHGELRGPFNLPARLKAGFDEQEMRDLEKSL